MASQALVPDPSLEDKSSDETPGTQARTERGIQGHRGSENTSQRLLDSVRALYPTSQQEAFLRLQAKVETLLEELQSVHQD